MTRIIEDALLLYCLKPESERMIEAVRLREKGENLPFESPPECRMMVLEHLNGIQGVAGSIPVGSTISTPEGNANGDRADILHRVLRPKEFP